MGLLQVKRIKKNIGRLQKIGIIATINHQQHEKSTQPIQKELSILKFDRHGVLWID